MASDYGAIDRIEPIADDPQFVRPTVPLFYWPLGIALGPVMFLALLPAMAFVVALAKQSTRGAGAEWASLVWQPFFAPPDGKRGAGGTGALVGCRL